MIGDFSLASAPRRALTPVKVGASQGDLFRGDLQARRGAPRDRGRCQREQRYHRPDRIPPRSVNDLCLRLAERLRSAGWHLETDRFRADMTPERLNDARPPSEWKANFVLPLGKNTQIRRAKRCHDVRLAWWQMRCTSGRPRRPGRFASARSAGRGRHCDPGAKAFLLTHLRAARRVFVGGPVRQGRS